MATGDRMNDGAARHGQPSLTGNEGVGGSPGPFFMPSAQRGKSHDTP